MIKKIGIFAVLSIIAVPALAAQPMQWGADCLKDAKMYCANMMKTDQQTWDCMAMNMDKLSPNCQKEMTMKKEKMAKDGMKTNKKMMKDNGKW